MARLYLKLDNVVLQEYAMADAPITIGRLPENTIQIDNLSVSGHHARIVQEQGQFVLYDENSTNGTYVNGQRVERAVLANGDTVHVGRHILSFEEDGSAPVAAPAPPPVFAAPEEPVGVITVLSGKTDQQEYTLTNDQTLIGKSEQASIHLLRWFAPKIATVIHRRNGKYFIAESATAIAVRVNSEVVHGERELSPGDTILVDEVTLGFDLKHPSH